MIGIKVNSVFLDLPLNIEMARNNPFLNDDDIPGENTAAFTIGYTENNYRALSYQGNYTRENKKLAIDAELYDNGVPRYTGKLVINHHDSNFNDIEQTQWQAIFTIGASHFYQDIRDKYLRDLIFGITTYQWTTGNPTDGSGGIFQHIHAAKVPNAFNYTFFPIRNQGWGIPGAEVDWMNKLAANSNNFLVPSTFLPLFFSPAIYVTYILNQIFTQHGWKLTGDLLNDDGFKKLTLQSFSGIMVWPGSSITNYHINLAQHMPPDVTIGQFITNLKTFLGCKFDFDSVTKTVTLTSCKSVIDGPPKDWTKYAPGRYSADYLDDTKVYALINNIDPSDDYPTVKIINYDTLLPTVANAAARPAPASVPDKTIFVFSENTFYISENVSGVYTWVKYADNIGDYHPDNADAFIETEITTMPMVTISHRTGATGLFPVCKMAPDYSAYVGEVTSWGMRFLFYHGMQPDSTGALYPFASCTNINYAGTVLTPNWVLPYKHAFGATNNGRYDVWFKPWLKLLAIQDYRTIPMHLPIAELKNFKWDDKIVINNVWYLVASIREVLPYTGTVEVKFKRIY